MTVVSLEPPLGRATMFTHIADFLEKSSFQIAAKSIRAQLAQMEFTNDFDMLKNCRHFVDNATLIVAKLEAGARHAGNEIACEASLDAEQQASQLIDGLLRRLMSAGHSFSDEKLNNSIEGVLNNDVFSKLVMIDCSVDKHTPISHGAIFEDVAACGVDLQRFSQPNLTNGIRPDTGTRCSEVLSDVEGVTFAHATGFTGTQQHLPQQSHQQQQGRQNDQNHTQGQSVPERLSCSAHYIPKRPRGSAEAEENGEAVDEYHDDDDPGYRIRDIYETELLAELSAKMAVGRIPDVATSADESADSTRELPVGDIDELAGATQAEALCSSPPLAWASKGAESGCVDGGPSAGNGGHGTVFVSDQDGQTRSSSPTFGGDAAISSATAPMGESQHVLDSESALAQTAILDSDRQLASPEEANEKHHDASDLHRHRNGVKYATSGDPFYPVELDGVVYDSFNLRVVYERDKTGFEESKEFPIRMNSIVAARYQIQEYLGSAAFSRAVQCWDLENNKMVCMKIIKNEKDFFDQSLDEIKLLKYINVNGDVEENCVLRLYDYFYHKEHLIIITELLRDNLYEFSKFNRESGDAPYFTIGRLQKIAKQVLTALEYVHSLRLIHCDLKPENILIKSYSRCEVKVIDFGSSCFVDDHLTSYVQSRSYRAPEVMLGLPYDQKIDLWSLGCILAELWTGYVLFQNDSVQSLLARILGIIGDFPYHLMTRGRYVPQYFTQDGQLYQELDGPACPERGRRLHLLVPKRTSLRQRMRTDSEEFLDFLEQLLQLDPEKRPTASEALQHAWITTCKYPDGLPSRVHGAAASVDPN